MLFIRNQNSVLSHTLNVHNPKYDNYPFPSGSTAHYLLLSRCYWIIREFNLTAIAHYLRCSSSKSEQKLIIQFLKPAYDVTCVISSSQTFIFWARALGFEKIFKVRAFSQLWFSYARCHTYKCTFIYAYIYPKNPGSAGLFGSLASDSVSTGIHVPDISNMSVFESIRINVYLRC